MSVISLVTTGNVVSDAFGTYRGSSSFWWGDLGEMVVYDRALTAGERKSVEDYLLAKWNTTGTVTTPVISPGGGMFNGSVEVSIATATPGAAIRYTLDGTEPTEQGSQEYAGPFTIDTTRTVKAKAFKVGLADSATATAGFTKDTDFTPRQVSNLQLWWRADAGVQSGDFVADQSDLVNHGVQPNGAAVATVVPNAQNGLPVLRFDGTSDFLKFTTRLTTIRTVFWVVKDSATASSTPYLLGDVTSGTTNFAGGTGAPGTIWSTSASTSVTGGQTFVNGVAVNGLTTPRPQQMSVISLVTTGNVVSDAFGTYRGAGNFWWGDLGEMVVYDRALNATERQQIETYLKAKYAIP
jgi:hypothetical protein